MLQKYRKEVTKTENPRAGPQGRERAELRDSDLPPDQEETLIPSGNAGASQKRRPTHVSHPLEGFPPALTVVHGARSITHRPRRRLTS